MFRLHRYGRGALMAMVAMMAAPALAHEAHTPLVEELVVYGRAQQAIGTAGSSSEGLVGYDDIRLPPLLRVGELVESVPGMIATQHSGTGKANQYFLRGFNLDHGTDFSAHADGVPVNMRSHGHGQGYLDLNFLIPELVATTSYRKGPYHAGKGDFSSAGSVDFRFYERLPESLASVAIGADDYRRGLLAGSLDAGAGVVTGAVDLTRYDGPWDLSEALEQNKVQLNYTFDAGGGRAKLGFQGYSSDWVATDQIPLRSVRSGLISALGFIDPDLGGSTERYALTASLDYAGWGMTAYVIDYDFSLFSNFTFLLDDPVDGDEFQQRDDRRVYGFDVRGGRDAGFAGRPVTVTWGVEARVDDIDEVGLYGTVARRRDEVLRQDRIEQRSLGGFGELELTLSDRWRAMAGLRADYVDWDVTAARPANSGSGDDARLSPKLGLAYRFADSVEGYANWGRGFHSNDVRGATIVVDPLTGEPVDPVDVLVATTGAELGIRVERGNRFNATVTGFWLELDSELVFVGDAGGTEANGATERVGLEVATFWQASDWLAMDVAYTYTDAAFVSDQGGGDAVPGAVESTVALGVNAVWANGLSASARVRYLGEAPLVEDASVMADDSLLVNAGVAYRRGAVELRLDLFNVFDSNDYDISYYYASRLPGEPAAGVEDLHFHPLEPRTLRASLTWHR